MTNKWFNMSAAANAAPAHISIYSDIGAGGVTAAAFEKELRGLGKPKALDLHISCNGGDVFQGTAIHSMLARLKANGTRITTYVDGVALSMGSLIAMVGDDIIMPANAIMMIHNPAGAALGTAEDVREMADVLDRLAEGMATVYAARSGKTMAQVQAIMAAETWYTAAEAVAAGFATQVVGAVDIAAKVPEGRYQHTPAGLVAPKTVGDLVARYSPGQHSLRRVHGNVVKMAEGYWANRARKAGAK